jgi:hypothetical protein
MMAEHDERYTLRLEAWSVLGRWQFSVQLATHDEDGRVVETWWQSATAPVPAWEDPVSLAEGVLDKASRMVRDLGLEPPLTSDSERLQAHLASQRESTQG